MRIAWVPLHLALAGLLWAWVGTAQADAVASPPAPWAGRVVPIPESDISGAEPAVRNAIDEARATLSELLESTDTDPVRLAQAYGRLGALLQLREVEAPADAAYRNARTLEPKAFRWPYYEGYLAMLTGNLDQALELFEAARALNPNYPTLYLRLGKVHLDRSELDQAKPDLERAAATPGIAAAAHLYLGQIANLERRYADAVSHLTKTLELDPNATEAQWPLAQAYRALGEDAKAREHMAQVEPRTPPAEDPLLDQLQGAAQQSVPAFERAIYAVDKRDYKTARGEFEAGLKAAPDNLNAQVSYARVLYLDGDRKTAESELDGVLAKDPDQTLALFLKGVLAQQSGDTGKAAQFYRRALKTKPDHPGLLYYLANLNFQSGLWAEAAAGYRKALAAEDPPPPAALLLLVAERRAGGTDAQAAAGVGDLVAKRPDDPTLRYAQIRLLALSPDPTVRQPKQALEMAQVLAYQQPGPQAARLLALAQAAAGDYASAAANIQQAIGMAGGWLPPDLQRGMESELADYRAGRIKAEVWPMDDPMLSPPPFDPTSPFRDYPAPVPY